MKTMITISQKCWDCSFQPGDGLAMDSALRAAITLYSEIAAEHTMANEGHRVETLTDGTRQSLMVFHPPLASGMVVCDQCQCQVVKAIAEGWDDLTLCPSCAGLDPCRCGHFKDDHIMGDECERCACENYRSTKG